MDLKVTCTNEVNESGSTLENMQNPQRDLYSVTEAFGEIEFHGVYWKK